jgi:hypothetical protein
MGCRVQAAEPVPAAEVPLRFILPGTAHLIEGSGEVMYGRRWRTRADSVSRPAGGS